MPKIWTGMMIAVLAIIPTASAHPGHGMGGEPHQWLHAPIDPIQVGVAVVLVAWFVGIVVLGSRARARGR